MTAERAFIGLGSNLGDREAALRHALRTLEARQMRSVRVSSIYLTEPVGGPPQDWFCNLVAEVDTCLSPEEALTACLATEDEAGRVRTTPNAPRTLDVDLLLFGGEVRRSARLCVPHPRMHERSFVLVPLTEIAPQARHPLLGLTAEELLRRCADRSRVVRRAPAPTLK